LLAAPGKEAERNRTVKAHHFDRLTQTHIAAASRRGLIGVLVAALFVPRLSAAGAVASQRETCPCPDPPCFLRKWGQEGNGDGQFLGPTAVAVAPDGTVYVADSKNHRIQYFDTDGTYLGQWGSKGRAGGQFLRSVSVAVAPDGTVYVMDVGNRRVQYFDAAGIYLGQWGSDGAGPGQFDHSANVAVAPDGTVYVADPGNDRIQYFDAAGTYLGQWGGEGTSEGQLRYPSDVAVAPDGKTVYVADTFNNRIQAFCVASGAEGARPVATPATGTPVVRSPAPATV